MLEESDELMPLKGYGGDFRKQKANLRIKGRGWGHSQNYVGGASNDLGWERQSDGTYAFHVSEFDTGTYNQKWQKKLLQHYSAEVVREVAIEHGYFLESEEEINEEIYLRVSSPF